MDNSNSSEIAINTVIECINSLEEVDININKINEVSYNKLQEKLTPIESAKLDISLAFGLASLLYINLKSQGLSTTDHPIQNDLKRIKEYVGKINQIENPIVEERKTTVNTIVAKRVISHQISSNKKKGKNKK